MSEDAPARSSTGRRTHPEGGVALRSNVGTLCAASQFLLLCLAVAGCATLRTGVSGERQAVIDRIVATSAKIMVEQGGHRVASASGVVVASTAEEHGDGGISYILTAAHILDGKEGAGVFIRFAGPYGNLGRFSATVLHRGMSETLDLALLRVSGVAVPPASFPVEDSVRLGEEILVVGFPWGKRLGLFSGIVSQVPSDGKDAGADEGADQSIVVDAASAKGVSGGGVFREATGGLVGIVEGYQTASIAVKDRSQTYSVKVPMPGETFVVPITRIRRFLEEAGLEDATGRPGNDAGGKD